MKRWKIQLNSATSATVEADSATVSQSGALELWEGGDLLRSTGRGAYRVSECLEGVTRAGGDQVGLGGAFHVDVSAGILPVRRNEGIGASLARTGLHASVGQDALAGHQRRGCHQRYG